MYYGYPDNSDGFLPDGYYDEKRLLSCLADHRNHSGQWEKGAGYIRYSFDVFLDFLGKLEYLVEGAAVKAILNL